MERCVIVWFGDGVHDRTVNISVIVGHGDGLHDRA